MEYFDPCLPPLPQTGSTGGNAVLALLVIGALVLTLMVFRAKTRKTATTLGLLVVMGGIAAALNLTPNRAFANVNPADCVTPAMQSTQPGETRTPTTTTPTPTTTTPTTTTPTPTTPTPTTPTPTTPAPTTPAPAPTTPVGPVDNKRVQGKVTVKGTVVEITDPAGIYPTMPATSELFPWLAGNMDPNGNWHLPTYVTGDALPMFQSVVTIYAPGADGVLGTADDREVGSSETGSDGSYVIPDLSAGTYRVSITLPTEPDFTARWTWEGGSCGIGFYSADDSSTEPLGTKITSAVYQDVTLSDTDPISSIDFHAENNYALGGGCRGDK